MNSANNKPTFLTHWQSMPKKTKSNFRFEFMYATGIGHVTFYDKKKNNRWTEMEKEWWALKLNLPKDELFPNN